MALDGIMIAGMVKELKDTIEGGKINKIAQPENDELMITIKNQRTQYRLLLSADASLPLIYLTQSNKQRSFDCPQFLYAASQAHRQRQNFTYLAARLGAHHQF